MHPGDGAEPHRAGERIGLLGGTFDPPHAGHLAIAAACRDALALDRVLLVVANHPWQKVPMRPVSPADDRYEMVAAAVEGLPRLQASRVEIDRGGPSYTVDTVDQLRGEAASAGGTAPHIFLIVGADLVPTLPTWHDVDRLRGLVTLVVAPRPGDAPVRPAGWDAVVVDADAVDVSSSLIRRLVGEGRPVDGLVPEPVVRCILRRGLYAGPR